MELRHSKAPSLAVPQLRAHEAAERLVVRDEDNGAPEAAERVGEASDGACGATRYATSQRARVV